MSCTFRSFSEDAFLEAAMLYVTAVLFQVGLVASVVLGIVCVFRRFRIGCRTHRWIRMIEQAEITLGVRTPAGPTSEKAPVEIWDHVVQFYAHDDELVDAVSGYLGAAISAEEVAVVVATKEHRQAFDVALAASGADVDAARISGSYIALDAAETVSGFVIDGYVDRHLFETVIGQLMRTASATRRPVRVYGEMVALLWDAGQINAAADLEALWNELGSVLPFSLYCAYPTHSVTGAANRVDLESICHLHSVVMGCEPPDGGDRLDDPEPTRAA